MSNLNHQHRVQIALMRTIWTTVSQMNGISFHTRLRATIFRRPSFCKPPGFPPPPPNSSLPPSLCRLLTNIKPALSPLRLVSAPTATKRKVGGLLHDHSGLDARGTEVSQLPPQTPLTARRSGVRKPCVWFLFSSPINEPRSGAAIPVRGGRGGLLAFGKDIPGIPLSV